jgi:RNA recognition motif-containing protein
MPSREGSRVFLGNLPHDVRERDIEKFFDKYGRVRNIFIKNGRYGFCVSGRFMFYLHNPTDCVL